MIARFYGTPLADAIDWMDPNDDLEFLWNSENGLEYQTKHRPRDVGYGHFGAELIDLMNRRMWIEMKKTATTREMGNVMAPIGTYKLDGESTVAQLRAMENRGVILLHLFPNGTTELETCVRELQTVTKFGVAFTQSKLASDRPKLLVWVATDIKAGCDVIENWKEMCAEDSVKLICEIARGVFPTGIV